MKSEKSKKAKKSGKSGKSGKLDGAGKSEDSAVVAEQVIDLDDHLNRSLDDVIELLEREIERLKMSLETYRLSSHPERAEIVRWHVRTLDERQDALEETQSLIIAEQQGNALH